mmetsp:Transcript_73966/g.154165  ORF Transcript_73966/g.154165 Transcript_73966/m.154165 type:complete len:396 (-) Transcript_73966:210-1397(-)
MAAPPNKKDSVERKGGRCKCCCIAVLQIFFYFWWGLVAQTRDFWGHLFEFPYRCEGGSPESLEAAAAPAPDSGVQVLVAGIAKMGTRTLSRSLYQLGLNHSYHSEEFGLFLWGPLADDYWLEKNGGQWSKLPKPGVPWDITENDQEVLNNTSPAALATALARCEVEALAFDGIERAFWPILEVSPKAKVILLNWRSYEEWKHSVINFMPYLMLEIIGLGTYMTGIWVLPWGALFRVLDPLVGGTIETMLKTGGPPVCQVYETPYVALFHILMSPRRVVNRWFSGMAGWPTNKEEFDAFHERVKAEVPPDRLIEWNMKKHGWEDLCSFLEMENCPKSGRLPRAVNAFLFLQDFPYASIGAILVNTVIHFLNYKIITGVFRVAKRLLTRSKPDTKLE